MKAGPKTLLFGAILGGALAQLLVVACGSVSSQKVDAKPASDTTAMVDSPAAPGAYQGFSYHTNGFVKQANWAPIVVDVLDYNAFGSQTYNVLTGAFTAPTAGYYRFTTHGLSPTATPGADTRTAVGLFVNGSAYDNGIAASGGQMSSVDTPLGTLSHVVHLNAGDVVTVQAYSTVAMTFGSPTYAINAFYFQGEYLGT
jgi:hypothetical protein